MPADRRYLRLPLAGVRNYRGDCLRWLCYNERMSELMKPDEQENNGTLYPSEITLEEDHYSNSELIRSVDINEKVTIRKNQILYRELKKDFHPVKWALLGLVVGAIFGMVLQRLVNSDSALPVSALLGGLIGLLSNLKKHDYQQED
jgi:hypothetical protein